MTLVSDNKKKHAYVHTTNLSAYKSHVEQERWPVLHEEKAHAPVAEGTDITFAKTTLFDGVGKDGHESRVATTIFLGYVQGDNTVEGGCLGIYPLGPSAIGGFTELLSQGYQAVKFSRAALHYVPACPTNTPGQFLMSYYDDIAAFEGGAGALGSEGLNDAIATNNAAAVTVWSAHTLEPLLSAAQRQYMTTDGGDARLEIQGIFVLQQITGITSSTTYGTLWLEVEVHLKAPRLSRELVFPVSDTMTLTWAAHAAPVSTPIYFNSVASTVTWAVGGPAGPISQTDPVYIWPATIIAVTSGSPPQYYTEDIGSNASFAAGSPLFLRSERVDTQQTLTLFTTLQGAMGWADDSGTAGTAQPHQLLYATPATYTGALSLRVRRIPYNN